MKLRHLTSLLALAFVATPALQAAEKSALRIKHEEIPGVMRAMTMQFRVDANALKAAQVGATITGLMSRQPDHWLLEDVKIVTGK